MRRKKRSESLKSLFLLIVALIFLGGSVSAASKKKSKKDKKAEEVPVETPVETSSQDSIKLPVGKEPRSFFYKVDLSVLEAVQNGSPESLKSAVSSLRHKGREYEENEKVLAVVAAEIMKLAWPSEKITWDIPVASEDNPYIGAINSVKQGVFDYSTGNVDFLTKLLPAMVILNSSDTSLYEPSEKAIKLALEIQPTSVLANYLMAVLYEKKKNTSSAEYYLEQAYSNSPKTEEIGLAYSRVLRKNGKLDQATEILQQVSTIATDIAILKQNAYIAFDSKDYDAAELYVAKVLQQNPGDLEFLLFRAKILIEKKDYIHAVSLLDMYARQDNSSIDYLILRAKVQLDWSKNTTAATETVEKALKNYPDNLDALMFAARISSETDSPIAGKYADELAASILQESPDNREAMQYALDGLIRRENWRDAYSICKSFVADESVSSVIIEKYVKVCLQLGKNSEAFDAVKKRYENNPSDEILMQAYVLAYSNTGNRDAVLRYINSALNTATPKMKSYLYLRRSYLQLTEDTQLADLRSSLISNPRNSEALFRLYEVYYDKKDYRKAQYYLRQVVAINPNDSSFKKLNEALTKLIQ